MHEAFAAIDTDRSGVIERGEFKAQLQAFGVPLGNHLIDSLMDACDPNRDAAC